MTSKRVQRSTRDVFGWEVEGRPTGVFHRVVPGGYFPLEDGSDSPIGNLHVGISDVAKPRPHPDPAGVEPRHLARDGRGVRVWILVGDDDSEDAILDRAPSCGAKELWRHHYWAEFNGLQRRVQDPWGNTVVLWTKGGTDPHTGRIHQRMSARRVTDTTHDRIRPGSVRWTHIALPCTDIDKTIDWYETFTPLAAARPPRGRRRPGRLARPSRPGRQAVHPRARQLLPRSGQGPAADHGAVRPHRHRDDRAEPRSTTIAARGEADGLPGVAAAPRCRRRSATSARSTDPDGNMIEFSLRPGRVREGARGLGCVGGCRRLTPSERCLHLPRSVRHG